MIYSFSSFCMSSPRHLPKGCFIFHILLYFSHLDKIYLLYIPENSSGIVCIRFFLHGILPKHTQALVHFGNFPLHIFISSTGSCFSVLLYHLTMALLFPLLRTVTPYPFLRASAAIPSEIVPVPPMIKQSIYFLLPAMRFIIRNDSLNSSALQKQAHHITVEITTLTTSLTTNSKAADKSNPATLKTPLHFRLWSGLQSYMKKMVN